MPESKRPLKVFLCHASQDKPEVRELYKRLTYDGVSAWLDVESLLPGQRWKDEIQKAIRISDIVLVCLSEKSINKNGYVQKEIKEALDIADEKPEGAIYIIPARLEECSVPVRLAEYQWVDLHSQDGYDKLLRAFKACAKSFDATFLPKELSEIEDVKSKAVQLEKEGSLPESLEAYSQLKRLEPAYSGIDEKIQELQYKSKKVFQLPKIFIRVLVSVLGFIALAMMSTFGLPSLFDALTEESIATNTKSVEISETQTSSPSSSSSYPTGTKTPVFTLTPTPLPTEITDAKGVSMIFVPEGELNMGNKNGENNERPVHKVYLETFYIDKYEVTNSQYKLCVDVDGCVPPSTEIYFSQARYSNHPVTFINWYMANAYCSWREARLPTEAEWEKAARGDSDTTYPWGDTIDCSYANYRGINGHCVGDSVSVGNFENGKSIYGVYDLIGNAMEWVSSVYVDYPYNANDGREGLNVGNVRGIRGGSWNNKDTDIHSTTRAWGSPSKAEFDLGFRCAKDATP